MSALVITSDDERRLRELASGIAKDIEDPVQLIARLGFTPSNYEELSNTRVFRQMLTDAMQEWQGAGNTQKRIKLKAAINIEQTLPTFYAAMINPQEPLSSRVKLLEIMMRAGGVGNPEPVLGGGGSAFNLTIQLAGGREVRVIEGNPVGDLQPFIHNDGDISPSYTQSKLLDALEMEEL